MSKTATINARIDPRTKKAAEAVFAQLGLTTTDAISLFLTQVGLHKGLPFEIKIPNKETRKALSELHTNKRLKAYASTRAMFNDVLK